MRVEKPGNGLYQAKVAQDQIEVVSNDLVTSTGALNGQITIVNNNLIAASSTLNNKIDTGLSNLRIRSLNAMSSAQFSTTSTATTFITGSNTIYDKKYSTTELRVNVFLLCGADVTNLTDLNIVSISYSVNGGSTWSASQIIRAASPNVYATTASLIHFNLGTLPIGNVDFRIGVARIAGTTAYIRGYSYQFIEAMENA